MEKAKIEIHVGIVKFIGEGEQEWLGKQLDKVLEKVPELIHSKSITPDKANLSDTDKIDDNGTSNNASSTNIPSNLSLFLREKKATTSQVNKFLVTAVYLQLNGQDRMSTTDVADALKSHNQSKLSNKSDALNQNVGKGLCEKEGSQFFVTQEGLDYVEEMQ